MSYFRFLMALGLLTTLPLFAAIPESNIIQDLKGFKGFRDSNIDKLFNNKKPAVLYLWSPQMRVSVDGLKEAIIACKKLGLPLYALVEPTADSKSVKTVMQQLGLGSDRVFYLDSAELNKRKFRLHFPSLIVINKGEFSSQIKRGHEDAEIYEEYIRSHM